MKTLPILFVILLAALTQAQAANGTVTTTLYPPTAGNIAFAPNFNEIRAQGGPIQSTCFDTTGQNLEFRRGFVEFALPVAPKRVVRATLTLIETRGTISTPVPTDVHELSAYPADLTLDVSDYDAPTTPILTFETDNNEPTQVFTFDVTDAVRSLKKGDVGFRIKLQIDPDQPCEEFDFAGSGFGEINNNPPTLEIEYRAHP